MLSIDDKLPDFTLNAMVDSKSMDKCFKVISNKDFQGKWLCLFFWPMDFTFVCPTEIATFGAKEAEFRKRKCEVVGCSVDSEFVHLAWKEQNKLLRENVNFPMMADVKRELCQALGILNAGGVANRATFIINPDGIIKFASVTDGKVGRNVDEVIRVLDALQTDKLCPCGWKVGEPTL
ncbi:MAG: peroxiredoxin [Rickettsiales bacterium]|nr:peroxiredoxin [Rickettsiales bacterium]